MPEFLTCTHEESSVGMAHGYFKATGKPLLNLVHGTVGLQHATMAIYNAWCDRVPVIVMGGNDMDAARRPPGVPTFHSAQDINAIVRDYTKWDDQPASPAAAREAIVRATWIANTAPMGPVYINLDAELQESKLAEPLPPIDVNRLSANLASCLNSGRSTRRLPSPLTPNWPSAVVDSPIEKSR